MKKAKFKSVDSMTLDALITDRKIYIKAKVENIYEKTLIIYVYGVLKEKRDEGYKCIFKQFITEFDFTAINYLDSEEGTWSESTLLRYIESNSWWIEVDNREYRDIKCASDSDNEIINNFYETNNKVGINLINDHQRELRKQAL